jgi:hypothetical protein
LIQPWRGAPPPPVTGLDHGSFHPSVKNVEKGNSRQRVGST